MVAALDTRNMQEAPEIELEPVAKLTRDLLSGMGKTGKQAARFIVDSYYDTQDRRIAANNQLRALEEAGEPTAFLEYLAKQHETLEKQCQRALHTWSLTHPVGEWSQSICGIGPVIAAGLLAHIDIERAPHVGHLWRYAGQDPTCIWLGKEKSAALVGEIFQNGEMTEEGLDEITARTRRNPETIRRFATEVKETLTRDSLAEAIIEIEISKNVYREREEIEALIVQVMGAARKVTDEHIEITAGIIGTTAEMLHAAAIRVESRWSLAQLRAGLAKRPWNAKLKCLLWKCGQSFMKVQNNENDFYGKLYVKRKAFEMENNAAGKYREAAAEVLRTKRIGKETGAYAAYSAGILPPAHIDARARRWAVKMFLSHWHLVSYFSHWGYLPQVQTYAIGFLGHEPMGFIPPPNMDAVPGMVDEVRRRGWNLIH